MTTATSFHECERIIINELSDVLGNVDETQIDQLTDLITGARKVFFVGVGRVELALEAIAKRLAHLGIDTVMVGQITEPAICDKDLPDSPCSSQAKPSRSVRKWPVSASSRIAR